jgi:hypothetical protein
MFIVLKRKIMADILRSRQYNRKKIVIFMCGVMDLGVI